MHTGPDGEQDHFPYKREQVTCTVGMLRQVYDNELMPMRRGYNDPPSVQQITEKIKNKTAKYIQDGKHNVSDTFALGRFETSIAGYHCSWYYYYPLLYYFYGTLTEFLLIIGVSDRRVYFKSGRRVIKKSS